MPTTDSLASSMGQLQVSREDSRGSKTRSSQLAESWEDESSDTETEPERLSTPVRPSTSDLPHAPPPTPSSAAGRKEQIAIDRSLPPFDFVEGTFDAGFGDQASTTNTGGMDKRPEKTASVASRLIAAGIGQKIPRRTEEQRQYDQAMKIQEKKKRDQAREAEERKKREAEQAKKAIWDD